MKKEIVRDLRILRKSCVKVEEKENIKQIVADLKDSLDPEKGYGLSANQIGYNKRIAYVKLPKIDNKTHQVSYEEHVIVNPKIVEKQHAIRFAQEGCLSLPGIKVDTFRYNFVIVECLDEKLEKKTHLMVGMKAIVFQHEIDHLNGKTLFDKKYRNKYT